MNALLRYFFRGLIVLVPGALTVYVVVGLFRKVDGLMNFGMPGVGVLATVGLITLIGLLASNFVGRRVFVLIERLFERLPLVKLLYTSLKELIGAFVGEKRRFDKPVLVTLGPGLHAQAVGFVTRESLEGLGLPDHVAVYFPQAYAFAGIVLVFPKDAVRALGIPASDAMAFLVSGGVAKG